ncbi:hypothetical protein SRHO_G00142330 [Serrasalmus rhombeus]
MKQRAALQAHFKRRGGVDAVDLIKNSMAATLPNAMMAKMSLKGKCGKLPFSESLLCNVICDTVPSTHTITQQEAMDTMAKYLKCRTFSLRRCEHSRFGAVRVELGLEVKVLHRRSFENSPGIPASVRGFLRERKETLNIVFRLDPLDGEPSPDP